MSSGGAFLLSLKSCFSCWGTAFFEELLSLLGYCFLQRVALVVGVLLSLKSLLCLVGCLLAFFEELLCMLCYLLFGFFEGLLYLWVAWLVERWSCVSCFSVSINKLEIYE